MKPIQLPILLLVAAGAVGCDENPVGPTPLRDVTWKLEAIERAGSPTVVVPNPEQYTLRLEVDGRLNVRADCNTCNARYALSGTSLSIITPLACTRAFCSLASLDGPYVAALDGAQSVFISNGRLILQGNGVTLRFRN
jgi:heat shock protein HslJ